MGPDLITLGLLERAIRAADHPDPRIACVCRAQVLIFCAELRSAAVSQEEIDAINLIEERRQPWPGLASLYLLAGDLHAAGEAEFQALLQFASEIN